MYLLESNRFHFKVELLLIAHHHVAEGKWSRNRKKNLKRTQKHFLKLKWNALSLLLNTYFTLKLNIRRHLNFWNASKKSSVLKISKFQLQNPGSSQNLFCLIWRVFIQPTLKEECEDKPCKRSGAILYHQKARNQYELPGYHFHD